MQSFSRLRMSMESPAEFFIGSVHRTSQRWEQNGVLDYIWALSLRSEELGGVNWQWQSADAAMALDLGDETGPNPTDRAKPGTKRRY